MFGLGDWHEPDPSTIGLSNHIISNHGIFGYRTAVQQRELRSDYHLLYLFIGLKLIIVIYNIDTSLVSSLHLFRSIVPSLYRPTHRN